MNKQIVALSDYPSFLLKWVVLQLLTISGSVSFLIFTVVQKELDVSKLTTELYVWFVVIGVLQVLSRVSPPCNSIIIDQLKGSLQVAHGTSVIRKLFELEHDSMISTPTGKFGQLISKIFMNVDKLLPALYGGSLDCGESGGRCGVARHFLWADLSGINSAICSLYYRCLPYC